MYMVELAQQNYLHLADSALGTLHAIMYFPDLQWC